MGLPLGEILILSSGSAFILGLIASDREKHLLNQIKNEFTQLVSDNNIENVNIDQFLDFLKTNRGAFLAKIEAMPVLETEIRLI